MLWQPPNHPIRHERLMVGGCYIMLFCLFGSVCRWISSDAPFSFFFAFWLGWGTLWRGLYACAYVAERCNSAGECVCVAVLMGLGWKLNGCSKDVGVPLWFGCTFPFWDPAHASTQLWPTLSWRAVSYPLPPSLLLILSPFAHSLPWKGPICILIHSWPAFHFLGRRLWLIMFAKAHRATWHVRPTFSWDPWSGHSLAGLAELYS